MNRKIYLIFSSMFFSQNVNLKSEKNTQDKKVLVAKNPPKSNKNLIKMNDEETVFNLLMKISQSEHHNDLFLMKFINEQKHGIEKAIKAGISALLSIAQIKLEEVPDNIILKHVSLYSFLMISSMQDILTETLNYSASDIKEMFAKSRALSKTPQKHKEVLSKLYKGDLSQLQYTMPEKHVKRLSNSRNYKKIISDLSPYSDILIDFIVFTSQNNNYDITDEEIDAINRLLNKKFKGKFYEQLANVNQSLEILKQEVQKDDFKNSSHFFDLILSQIADQISTTMDQKLKNKPMVNIQNLSASDKKELIQTAIDAIYVILEDLQPNKIEKLIKKIKKIV